MEKNSIRETLAFKELTEEEKKARGILGRLYGPCADFLNPTRNGRLYSDEVWDKVFNENELVKEAFENGGIPGELDHPTDREEIDSSKIAIIMPEKPKKDKDGKLIAYFDILDTPNGRIAYALAKYGYKLGISSRGTGDVDEYNDSVIPESYDFKCFDLVLTPSVKDARLKMVESLDTNKAKLNKTLCESLNSATPEDKKIMEETLDKLNIKLNEDQEDVTEIEKQETEVPEEKEESFEDKIKKLFSLIYKGDEAPKDEEIEAFVQAFVSIFPEECFNPEGCTDKEESEESKEAVSDSEEVIDDKADELIVSLQDALTKNSELEAKLKSLQEQLAVSDTKVNKSNEEIDRYKESIVRLSEEAHLAVDLKVKVNSLEEELKSKDSKLEELTKNSEVETSAAKSLKENLSTKDSEISRLNESLNTQKEEYETKLKKLNEELESTKKESINRKSLLDEHIRFTKELTESYIDFKATMFGVDKKVIKSKLPRKYDLKDIDRICENLQDYSQLNQLPFDLNNKNITKVVMTESKNDNLQIPSYVDDTVDDSLLDLAGIK